MVLAAAVGVSSLSTWVAAEQIQSPAEVAARTAPPRPSLITAPVEQRVLSSKVVTRGTAHYGSPRELSVVRSRLKDGARVVTALPEAGDRVAAGDVLLAVSGRPVFLLQGRQPAYRDLGPGMVGPDVRQLERALVRVGLEPGAVDGLYDVGTEAAVSALYDRNGFAPLVAAEADLAAARPAEAAMVAGARAGAGVQLPCDEVVFVPRTPLRVTELPVAVGEPMRGALLTVTDSEVVVDGLLPVEQADRVREDAPVVIDEPTLGLATEGRVTRVAGRTGTRGADGFSVAFTVAVDRVVPGLVGSSVRLTVPVESTRRRSLAVPASAVSLGADGRARVEVVDGGRRTVPVRTGLSADGYVAVTPLDDGLRAGDRVVIGVRSPGLRAGRGTS